MKQKLKDRYIILSIFFIIFGILMVLQLVNLQIVKGEYYDKKSQWSLPNVRTLVAGRGSILDRNFMPLAVNRIGYTVWISNVKMSNDELNDMLLRLVNILKKNNDTYESRLSRYIKFGPFDYGSEIDRYSSELEELEKKEKKQELTEKEKKQELTEKEKKRKKEILDDFEFRKEKFKKEMARQGYEKEDIALMKTPEDIFDFLRDVKFKISDKYTDEQAYNIMAIRFEMLIQGSTATIPIRIAKDVSIETMAELEEKHHLFPGINTDREPMRKYVDADSAAHVLGYVRIIDEEEYEKNKDNGYKKTDLIGKTGIEFSAEKYLKGKDGYKRVEVDTKGRLTQEISTVPAVQGNDVILTLDMKLQKTAMESLKSNIEKIRKQKGLQTNNYGDASAGAAVAIDVKNGEILAMANYPSYDPSIFLADADDKAAQKAISDLWDPKNVGTPGLNRAIQGWYTPGSTFKPLTSVAALEEGIITPSTVYYDSGRVNIGGWIFKCLERVHGHGNMDLEYALATSCNVFFHWFGYKTGIDDIAKWARNFGLGEYTGIDIPGESKGALASKEYKDKVFKEDWWPADTGQASIGQSFNAFTPIQIANYVSTIANGGKRYTPHLIKKVIKYDGSTVTETKPEYKKVPVKKETIDAVKKGMEAVANSADGTAADVFKDFPFKVAGKTGTAETGREGKGESSNALFVAYAPADNPQIAVAVVVEHGAWGSNVAPIARDILAEYFDLNRTHDIDETLKPDYVELTH